MPDASPPLQLFIIYAREDQAALLELKSHLRPLEKRGDLRVWYDGEILPGEKWDDAIKAQLQAADIVLLFISKSFFNSEYIEKEELKKALARHQEGTATVIPVIVKPCAWDVDDDIAALQALPKDSKAVTLWGNVDEAWTDVVRGVQKWILAARKSTQEAEDARIAAERVEEAIKAYDAGQIEEAFKLLSQYTATPYPVNPRGYHILGKIYHLGEGRVAQDYTEAVIWYHKAAEQGNATAQSNLGWLYLNGNGVFEDCAEAATWFQKAAEQGDADGQNGLGHMYRLGEGVARDYVKAVKWFRKAAEQGSASGQNNLGYMYRLGLGVSMDETEAVKWYRKSAAQGDLSAKANLKRLGYSE